MFVCHSFTSVNNSQPTHFTANLGSKKKNWIDFDASPTLEGNELTDELFDYVVSVAGGRETQNEINDYREISIFKDGVTL